MRLTKGLSICCLAFAVFAANSSGATIDTIKGVVSDTFALLKIDSVLVSSEGITTRTDAEGAFTLSLPTTGVRLETPGFLPSLTWHPEGGTFSWEGYYGEVAISVYTLRGNIVSSGFSSKKRNSTSFSIASLPKGIYTVAIEAHGKRAVYKINSLNAQGRQSFLLESNNHLSKSTASGTSATHILTFSRSNFDSLKRTVPAGNQASLTVKMKSPYPMLNVIKLFTDPTIPDRGPMESPTSPVGWTKPKSLTSRIGGGPGMHPFLYIGETYHRICLMVEGKLIWHYDTENSWEDDEVWMISNGNIIHAHMGYIEEITPKKQVVWRYDAPAGTEIHTCQPIGLDKVLFLHNQLPCSRIKIYNIATKEFELDTPLVQLNSGVHGQGRRIRLTTRGTYVVGRLHNQVLEYDQKLNVLWSKSQDLWGITALQNGNVLMTDVPNKGVIELKNGVEVWRTNLNSGYSLPADAAALGSITTAERLANGNTVLMNDVENNPNSIQMYEITPDKKIVWMMQDWINMGGILQSQFLDEPGYPEIVGQTNH